MIKSILQLIELLSGNAAKQETRSYFSNCVIYFDTKPNNLIIPKKKKKKSNLTTGRCYNKQKHVCSFSPQSHAFNMTRLSCHGNWALLNHLDPSLVHAAMLHLRIFRTGSVTSVATDEVKMPVSFEYFVVSLLPDHVDEQTCCFITPPRVFYPYFLLVFWNCSFEAVTDCCWKFGVFVI